MAEIVSGSDFAFRIDELDFEDWVDGPYLSRSATSFAFDTGGGYVDTFEGRDFTFDNFGDPVTGQIEAIHETRDGAATFDITGLDISVDAFAQLAFERSDRDGFAALLSGDDSFAGSTRGDYVEGFAGHDYLAGGDGADTIGGGSGNDHIYGQSSTGGPDGNDDLHGDDGSDYIQGNAGNDSIDGGAGLDRLVGGQGADLILGSFGDDSINGNLGNDVVRGEEGDDSLRGGQGNDTISGGDGSDLIMGDLGSDELRGGNNADVFVVAGLGSTIAAGVDTIFDFADGTDHLALDFDPAVVLTGTGSELSAQSAAQALFDANAGNGEVAAIDVGTDTYLFFSSNGGATADSAIRLIGVDPSEISLADFI